MASKRLVQLALAAAMASDKARAAQHAWAEKFEEEYGHSDISDELVELIDYGAGDSSNITAEFIDKHSGPGRS